LAHARMGRLQRPHPQRMGGHEKLGRPLGRRDLGRTLSEGVRRLSLLGSSGYRRHRVCGARERARSEGGDRSRRPLDHLLPGVAFALVLIASGLLAGCGDTKSRINRASAVAPPKAEEESFTSIDSPSLQFLPRQQEAPGWRLEQDPIVVPANRLVSYLGADGNHFVHYEAIDLTQGKYSGVGNGGFATVEIFRFPDFVKAFGSYSTRKEGPIQFL